MLENLDAPYKVIRINSNYIHNEEQYKFDVFKIKNIVKQIKKKTFSLKMKTMNMLLDLNDDIKINPDKNIDVYRIGYGLPAGGDIEYADEVTLLKSLEGRREL